MARIQEAVVTTTDLVMMLKSAPEGSAIGAAVAFLLDRADVDSGQLRAVLNTAVAHGHLRERRIIDVLARVAG